MIIEQYELRFIHKIIDTEDGRTIGKLEPDYTTVFNVIANNYDIPKTEIYERLLYEMEKGLMKNVK